MARGVAYFDKTFPGWREYVDWDVLDMSSGCNCIVGQVVPCYTTEFVHSNGSPYLDWYFSAYNPDVAPEDLGFDTCHESYAELTDAWLRVA